DFAANVHRNFAREIAAGDCRGDFGDITNLTGEVAGHEVHVIGQVFPRAGHAGHLRLTTELAVGADFASDARDFPGERVQLVHHRGAGGFGREDFAFHVDGDLARQVAAGHSRGDLCDVTHLTGQVTGH